MDQQFKTYSGNRSARPCPRIQPHTLIISAFVMALTSKILNQIFCMTLKLIMMHQCTKFGNKTFGLSENISYHPITHSFTFGPLL